MIMLVPNILILVGVIWLLVQTQRPFLCAGIWVGIGAFFQIVCGAPTLIVLVGLPISFGLAALYFWLLNLVEEFGWSWWGIALGFPVLLFAVRIGLALALDSIVDSPGPGNVIHYQPE